MKGTKADSYRLSLLKHIMRADGERFLLQAPRDQETKQHGRKPD